MPSSSLTLSDTDPAVLAARKAENDLFDFYGLKAGKRFVFLTDQGIRVRVLEFGSGEPLIIIPGNTGDVFPLASLLAEITGRRIIAINRPGGGLSEGMDHRTVNIRDFAVKTLTTVLDAFQLTDADVLAHSMGAQWSLWLAMDAPRYVRSLTLLGNPGNVLKGKPPFLLRLVSRPPMNKWLLTFLVPSERSKALKGLKPMGHSTATIDLQPDELGDCYFYFRQLPHYRVSLLSLMENVAPNIGKDKLGKIGKPVLFLLGTNDTFASVDTGHQIAAALPHCSFQTIEGAGHLPWLENPKTCGKIINAFLAKHH